MTGSDFLAYVKKNFQRPDKDSELYECMTDVVMDIRLRMLSEDSQEEAYVTGISTLGEYRLALPSDFGHLIGDIAFKDTSSDQVYPPLVKLSKTRYDSIYYDRLATSTGNQNSGPPVHYCIYAEQIYLGPVPDSINYQYYLNYTIEDLLDSDITSGSTVPFTDKYRKIVRDGVLFMIYDQLENFSEADKYEVRYERGVQKIVESENFNQQDSCNMEYCGY